LGCPRHGGILVPVVEGQINRLKTLKRAMYGRAGVELLPARLVPFLW
jgi:hypothetical protein